MLGLQLLTLRMIRRCGLEIGSIWYWAFEVSRNSCQFDLALVVYFLGMKMWSLSCSSHIPVTSTIMDCSSLKLSFQKTAFFFIIPQTVLVSVVMIKYFDKSNLKKKDFVSDSYFGPLCRVKTEGTWRSWLTCIYSEDVEVCKCMFASVQLFFFVLLSYS